MTVKTLIIDNDAEGTKKITDMLRGASRAQFTFEVVTSATDGMSLLHRSRFDVVILNCCLEDMDGITFMDFIHADRFRIPVIILTNPDDKATQAKALEHGAADYLEKGMFNGDLLERTCIYAIGLQEKMNADEGDPKVLISQLVDLTRDSVKAQATSTVEIKELRQELNEGFKGIRDNLKDHDENSLRIEKTALGIQDRLTHELQQIGKVRWFLSWVKENPVTALILFFCIVIILGLGVLFVVTATPEQIKAAGDAAGEIPKLIP